MLHPSSQPSETYSITPNRSLARSLACWSQRTCLSSLSVLHALVLSCIHVHAHAHTHTHPHSKLDCERERQQESARNARANVTATLRRTCILSGSSLSLSVFHAPLRSWLNRSFDFSWQKFLALCGPLCALTFLQNTHVISADSRHASFLESQLKVCVCVCVTWIYVCVYVQVTELGSVNWFSGSLAKGIKNTDTHTHTLPQLYAANSMTSQKYFCSSSAFWWLRTCMCVHVCLFACVCLLCFYAHKSI